jgi:hypothetical protein
VGSRGTGLQPESMGQFPGTSSSTNFENDKGDRATSDEKVGHRTPSFRHFIPEDEGAAPFPRPSVMDTDQQKRGGGGTSCVCQ